MLIEKLLILLLVLIYLASQIYWFTSKNYEVRFLTEEFQKLDCIVHMQGIGADYPTALEGCHRAARELKK